jgi:hypothetical protein
LEENDELEKIKQVIIKRLDGLKNRDPEKIRDVVNPEVYSRIDDWPPGLILKGQDALKNEEAAIKVLEKYLYKIRSLDIKVKDNFAWTTFLLNYEGLIRRRIFNIESRVSIILESYNSNWRIVQEHFSMIPVQMPVSEELPITERVAYEDNSNDDIQQTILKILDDGQEKHVAQLTKEISEIIKKDIMASQIVDACKNLVDSGVLIRRGRFYPRYRLAETKSN